MIYILFIHSIDDVDRPESINFQHLDEEDSIKVDGRDFNYDDLSMEELSAIRMPFINCNRKVFCNYDFNWALQSKFYGINLSKDVIVENYDEIIARLSFILSYIKILVSDGKIFNRKNYVFRGHSIKEDKLCYGLASLKHIMLTRSVIYKLDASNFLLETESYLDELSDVDLFKLLFGSRPSVILNDVYTDECLKIDEFKEFMRRICIIYNRVYKYIISLKVRTFRLKKDEYNTPCSYYLKEYILIKWMIEIERVCVIYNTKKLKKHTHMLIYSINVNKNFFKEISNIIKCILDPELCNKIECLKLAEVPISNYNNNPMFFSCYEYEHINKKRYIIKIFDLEKCEDLPSGLSTSYLNCKDKSESLGFLAVMGDFNYQIKYVFLSVEEIPNFYLSKASLDIFKNNVIQAFYFVVHVLELQNTLNMYKIELLNDLNFAVYNNNNKNGDLD